MSKDKLYVHIATGQWDCKVCGLKGNHISFLEETYRELLQGTELGKYKELAKDRGIPAPALKAAGLAYDPYGRRWALPGYAHTGRIWDLRHWQPGRGFYSTPGCKVQLWNGPALKSAAKESEVYLCEGEWDGIALDWLRQQAGAGGTVVAVPGATILKEEWIQALKPFRVTTFYDNDNAGRNGAVKSGSKLQTVRHIVWPAECKEGYDVRDYVIDNKARCRQGQALQVWEELIDPQDGRDRAAANGQDFLGENINDLQRPFGLTSLEIFNSEDYRSMFLIDQILVQGQDCILGGLKKVLKTSVSIDMVLALATGTKFLGVFDVPEKQRILFLSGESGKSNIQSTFRRVARERGIKSFKGVGVELGFRLPQIGSEEHMEMLREEVILYGIRVCVLDPAYLCLMRGGEEVKASNLFDMGKRLQILTDIGQQTGCTMVLVHHLRKNSPNDPFQPPELEDLAMAGFSEWARQWILLGRRRAYEQGSGLHKLWLNVGGSEGHSGCWGLDIEEGPASLGLGNRTWIVSIQGAAKTREASKAEREESVREGRREKLLQALRQFPDGETPRILRLASGLNPPNFGEALAHLVKRGRVQTCTICKAGKGYEGYKLVQVK